MKLATLLTSICLTAVLFSAHAADASSFTAKELQQQCLASDDSELHAACILYVAGFMSALWAVQANNGGIQQLPDAGTDKGMCIPEYYTPAEAEALFIRVVRSAPAVASMPAHMVLYSSLAVQFPCQ